MVASLVVYINPYMKSYVNFLRNLEGLLFDWTSKTTPLKMILVSIYKYITFLICSWEPNVCGYDRRSNSVITGAENIINISVKSSETVVKMSWSGVSPSTYDSKQQCLRGIWCKMVTKRYFSQNRNHLKFSVVFRKINRVSTTKQSCSKNPWQVINLGEIKNFNLELQNFKGNPLRNYILLTKTKDVVQKVQSVIAKVVLKNNLNYITRKFLYIN